MAFGMRHWIGLTAAGMAIAAVYLYPPRTAQDVTGRFVRERAITPASDRLVTMEGRARELRGNLQRVRWLDSLRQVMDAEVEAGHNTSMGVPDYLSDQFVALYREAFDEEVAAAGGGRSDVHVGVYPVPRSGDLPDDLDGRTDFYGWEHYAGTLPGGQPYCLSMIPAYTESEAAGFAFSLDDRYGEVGIPLGACRHWARYGPPGPEIDAWLRAGAITFGILDRGSIAFEYQVQFAQDLRGRSTLFNLATGDRATYLEYMDWRSEACLRGDMDACRRLLTEPRGQSPTPGQRVSSRGSERDHPDFLATETSFSRWIGAAFPAPTGILFEDLQAEFGEEAFQRFWASNQPVPEAFEAAFGVELGEWVYGWVTSYVAPAQGPGMKFASVGLSLLVLLAAVVIGLRVQLRRQVS